MFTLLYTFPIGIPLGIFTIPLSSSICKVVVHVEFVVLSFLSSILNFLFNFVDMSHYNVDMYPVGALMKAKKLLKGMYFLSLITVTIKHS